MNAHHKCLFHPTNPIVKFCENRECTLPLCLECQSIHLQEHLSQQSEAKVVRFNEATLKAANTMEDYIEDFKKFQKDMDNKMANDREVIMKMIDQYYTTARKMVNEIKENVNKVSENLNKLNKGSIKALIFYYSGDIKLNKFDLQFEPLQHRFRNTLQKREEKPYVERKVYQKPEQNYQANNVTFENQQRPQSQISVENIIEKQRTKDLRNNQSQDNVFSNIQEIKEERNHSRNRKSIFENNKKGSSIIQNNPSYRQSRQRQAETKYNYLPQYEQYSQEIRAPSVEQNTKFNYNARYDIKSYEPSSTQPQILSFQNRFLNKFSCADQLDRNKAITVKQGSQPEIKYDEGFSKKPLKCEDLELQKQNSNIGGRTTVLTNQSLTQRNRSLSQNNFNDKEIKNKNYDYDLKKQVLSPDEIRKMLQKKIQERNRVLSIKKSDNYQMPQEKGRKGWETRESIINQIYSEPKY